MTTINHITRAEVFGATAEPKPRNPYEARVWELEAQGCTTSDAQGIADAEGLNPMLPPPTVEFISPEGEASARLIRERSAHLIVDQSDTNQLCQIIKAALERRSGKKWSVTHGTGTAYGWIRINVPPARRTGHYLPKPGHEPGHMPDDFQRIRTDTGEKGGYITEADAAELAELLGKKSIHCQGESIPSGGDYRREYVHRALYGNPGSFNAQPYWD